MNFASDNVYGVHPRILAALSDVNAGTAPSYGSDILSKRAEERLSEVFEKEVRAFLMTTGTAANGLALSAIAPPFGAILCHAEAHVAVDECGSPELFTGGAKMIGLPGPQGKITPALIEKTLKGFIRGEHDPKPAAVSITNASELGTTYKPGEIRAISALIKQRGMKLHMDGARFANSVAGIGASPAEITWRSGVDVMSFGATKNGAMMLEAVVFFDLGLAEDFIYRRMRGGQLVSKSRYLGAQMLAYLDNDLWLENARTANGLARKLAEGLRQSNRVRLAFPVEANEIFVVMPKGMDRQLRAAGAHYFDWMPDSLDGGLGADDVFMRLVTSYATPPEAVEKLLAAIK
jgi:threonine aldolase